MGRYRMCCNCRNWEKKKKNAQVAFCSFKNDYTYDFDGCREEWKTKRSQLPSEQNPGRREDSVWMAPGGIPLK